MSARSLLFLSPGEFKGENLGVYVQHAASLAWLLGTTRGWTVKTLPFADPRAEGAAVECDVLVLHMVANPGAEAIIRRRRAAGRPTVFEISDNFLDLGAWLPRQHPLRSPLVRQRILFHAWLCDALQVYAAPLATLFGSVNARIGVLDPYVPLAPNLRPETGLGPRAEDAFVLGWGGTTSHAGDLARIAPAIVDFCGRHRNAVFAFMGDDSLLGTALAGLPAEQLWARPFGPYEDYLDFVRTWDAGLAPLARGGFADARTDTKFVTYAACGVAAILEQHPIHAAHADRALLFDGVEALTAKLEWLYEDRSRAVALGCRAHAWVARERSAEALSAQRIDFYGALLQEAQADPTPVDPSPLETLRRSHRDWPSRVAYFRRLLEEQPYDYVALRAVIADAEACRDDDGSCLDTLYRRLCLLAPEDVRQTKRPTDIRGFLPA